MAEPDADRHGHEREREQRDRWRERDAKQPDRAEDEAHHERRLVAEAPDDRPDEPALDHRAEQTERREQIAGLRPAPNPNRRATNSPNVV